MKKVLSIVGGVICLAVLVLMVAGVMGAFRERTYELVKDPVTGQSGRLYEDGTVFFPPVFSAGVLDWTDPTFYQADEWQAYVAEHQQAMSAEEARHLAEIAEEERAFTAGETTRTAKLDVSPNLLASALEKWRREHFEFVVESVDWRDKHGMRSYFVVTYRARQ